LIAHQRTRYRKVSLTVHGTDDQIGHGAAGAIVDGAVPVDGVVSVDGAVKTREEQGRRGRSGQCSVRCKSWPTPTVGDALLLCFAIICTSLCRCVLRKGNGVGRPRLAGKGQGQSPSSCR
jgi:hypothetical protein